MFELEFEMTELGRRVANMVRLGKVAAIDYAGSIPKVRVHIKPLTTAWLPLLSLRAGPDSHWWPVEIGEQVVVLSPSGELNQGVVLGALHQQRFAASANTPDVHRMTYSDGAVIEYDRSSHALSAVLPSGATTELVSDGGVTITGDVTITGNITVSENANIQNNVTVGGSTTTNGVLTTFISSIISSGGAASPLTIQNGANIEGNTQIDGNLDVNGIIESDG